MQNASYLIDSTDNVHVFPGCDPGGHMCRLFEDDRINSKPELLILNWLVAIPFAIDPAFAARAVLARFGGLAGNPSVDQASVIALLKQIASHPRQRLLADRAASGRRRRSR